MLRSICVVFAFVVSFSPVLAQYYPAPGGPVYNTPAPHHYHHGGAAYRPVAHRPRAGRSGVVWRPHRVVIEFRAYPRRAHAARRYDHRTGGYAYRPAPAYYPPQPAYQYQSQPVYRYEPQPAYPTPVYRPAPRAVSAAGATQEAACARIANPASRRACHCTVSYGGTASISGHGQVGWREPAGGGGIIALQQCKAGY